MKLKNIFHALGLKSSVRFFGAERVVIGEYKNSPLSFYQWRTPKSSDVTLNLAEVDELKSFISEGDIAIDVGAHIGDSTLPIALACGSSGGVYAFEPNPIVFSILAILMLGWQMVEISQNSLGRMAINIKCLLMGRIPQSSYQILISQKLDT